MSVLDRPDYVPVPLGYCPCQGTPHPDGDIVYLYPELSMSGGMAAQGAIADAFAAGTTPDSFDYDSLVLQERLASVWIRHGVADWTFLDDWGSPIPVTPANVIRALPYAKGGREVADKADDLYGKVVTTPLVERLGLPSSDTSTRTPRPTSRNGTTRKSRRSPSSTATTDRAPLDG